MRNASQGQLLAKLTLSVFRTAWKHKLYTIQIVVFLAGGYMAETAQTEAAYILGNHSQTAMVSSLAVMAIADRRIRSAGLLESDLRSRYDSKNEALERDKARLAEDSSKVASAKERLTREISDFEVKRDNYRDSIKISLEKENEATKQLIQRDLRRDFDNQTKELQGEYKRLEASLRKEVETEKRNAASAVSVAQEAAEKVKRDAAVATQRANEIMAECAADKAGVAQAAKRKVQEVIGINQAEKKEFAKVLTVTNGAFEDERKAVNLKFQQLAGQIISSGEEIGRLEQEVRRLRETRFTTGGTEEAKLCRRIHIWLENRLDTTLYNYRAEYAKDGLYLCAFRNQTRTLEDFQKVKSELATHISAPIERIEQRFDEGSIEIFVRLTRKTVIKAEDISRLCHSDEHYLKRSMHWPRVQFLAPSETGKTSSAEILAHQFILAKNGHVYFHFPNENSVKNYVVSPIASMGTDECIDAFSRLARRVDSIQNGNEAPPENFEYHIFDDSDSIISQAIKQNLTRQEILDFFTRASHCHIGFCLNGHSTAANNFPGFTHSDFNNLVRIYAGADIMTGLMNTQVVSEDRAKSLKTQYEKIRDYFESKNKELGLVTEGSSADPQAYRFALIVEPNSRPYFCQLPRLDLLSNSTLSSSNGTDVVKPTAEQPTGVGKGAKTSAINGYGGQTQNSLIGIRAAIGEHSNQSEQSLESFNSKGIVNFGYSHATPKSCKNRGGCPECGSSNVKSNGKGKGKYKGMQKYFCQDLNHPSGKSRTFYG